MGESTQQVRSVMPDFKPQPVCVFLGSYPKTTALMATVARVIQSSQGTLISEIQR